jgi:polyphosphate kinase
MSTPTIRPDIGIQPEATNGEPAPAAAPGAVRIVVPRAVSPLPVPKRAGLSDPRLYFNRELSWLDFNWRVLYQALDERSPVLERVRFLAITASNLDEFFRKRMGGLKRQAAAGVARLSPDGRTPVEQIALCQQAVQPMIRRVSEAWLRVLRPALAANGIRILDYADLDDQQMAWLHEQFIAHIFPILTPLAVDPGHPFPFISNLSLSLAVTMRHPKRGTEHFARLKVPTARGRWIRLPGGLDFVPVEQVIAHNIDDLFRGMKVTSVHAFRITRNADIRRDEEEADDLIEMIADELRERRFAPIVRLEVEAGMPPDVRTLLMRELGLKEQDVYEVPGEIDLTDLHAIADLDRPDLRYEPWEPVVPERLRHAGEAADREDIFTSIRAGDLLVHHPYESFAASVLRFVEEAAEDPAVIAIKLTLYRTSDESPIVDALIRAAERGKQVAVLVEVKARFDEMNNIEWGQMLEKAGVHVTYGLVGLKTHTKTTLVIREEADGLRAYCHIGTGNYNPKTARLYTDLGLFTSARDVGFDIINLFHYLTGYAPEQHYRRLIIAPRDMRDRFVEMLHAEIGHQKATGNGQVIAKMNALDDPILIRELYRASEAGVQIDLIVRGHSRLRPGLPRFSENIRVISILGRFLEHSRIYYFRNNDRPRVLIGSGDWQRRNLDDRVEATVEIDDPALRARLIRSLEIALRDRRSAWELDPNGVYGLRWPGEGDDQRGCQEILMDLATAKRGERGWDIA